jgi:hypothetical protein
MLPYMTCLLPYVTWLSPYDIAVDLSVTVG